MRSAPQFDPVRSDAIVLLLSDAVSQASHPTRRHRSWLIAGSVTVSLLLAGSAAAWAATSNGWIAVPAVDPSGTPTYATVPAWPINAHGQTYGVQGDSPVPPDLIQASGTDSEGHAVIGYISALDEKAAAEPPTSANTPQKVIQWQQQHDAEYPHGVLIPLYKSDGVTKVGTFCIGTGCR